MAITLITGVPGTGKTAYVVAELEKIAASGRVIFSNIANLKIPHYRLGRMCEWHKGAWLHIDRYQRTGNPLALDGDVEDDEDNKNWLPGPDVVVQAETGEVRILVRGDDGQVVVSVPYESHKGALVVFDECQDIFRPRPAGSAVPDHVAALEVHRHQGLDFWLITQRPNLIDANVRGLVGRHVALRSTALGSYKYEWAEVGDIESKFSRDTAARSRYKLPSHVFGLYKSADVHTVTKHTLPMAAKLVMIALPVLGLLLWMSYKTIAGKINPAPPSPIVAQKSEGNIQRVRLDAPVSAALPAGFEPYSPKQISGQHPYQNFELVITGHIKSATREMYSFNAMQGAQSAFMVTSAELVEAGYFIEPLSACAVKIIYKATEFFAACNTSNSHASGAYRPLDLQPIPVTVRPPFPSS